MNLTTIPVRFSCWSHLVVTQALLSCDHVSFKGHLSGILAGLLHVFLPKAGGVTVRTEQNMYQVCMSMAVSNELLFVVAKCCVVSILA